MLDKEFQYYLANQDKFVKDYNGQFLVIVGGELIGVYESQELAYFNTIKDYKLGTFLIQQCTPGDEAYTQTFHSNVVFE